MPMASQCQKSTKALTNGVQLLVSMTAIDSRKGIPGLPSLYEKKEKKNNHVKYGEDCMNENTNVIFCRIVEFQ